MEVYKRLHRHAELKNKDEWKGTKIIWDISSRDAPTTLTVTYQGLSSDIECYEVCEKGWTQFLTESL